MSLPAAMLVMDDSDWWPQKSLLKHKGRTQTFSLNLQVITRAQIARISVALVSFIVSTDTTPWSSLFPPATAFRLASIPCPRYHQANLLSIDAPSIGSAREPRDDTAKLKPRYLVALTS